MSREIDNGGVVVPRSMVWSFILNMPFAFGLLLTYLFCMVDIDDALSSPTGYPFIYVFQTATEPTIASTILSVVILVLIMITISCVTLTPRQTFAFARDDRSPFFQLAKNCNSHSYHLNLTLLPLLLSCLSFRDSHTQVDLKRHVPVNAPIFTFLYSSILSLINIGSTVAFNALLSLCTVALTSTYNISIGCVAMKLIRGEQLPPCLWSLGRYGLAINLIALIWPLWSFFWSCSPNSHDVTAKNFNWACVIFVGIMGISSQLYGVRARHIYDGPVVKVHTS